MQEVEDLYPTQAAKRSKTFAAFSCPLIAARCRHYKGVINRKTTGVVEGRRAFLYNNNHGGTVFGGGGVNHTVL